jgi:hypothetical protein
MRWQLRSPAICSQAALVTTDTLRGVEGGTDSSNLPIALSRLVAVPFARLQVAFGKKARSRVPGR